MPNTISGTPDGDVLEGTPGIDYIYGLEGADELRGLAGKDRLFGGDGDDMLFGGADNDRLFGGLGDDLLDGGTGFDEANYADADGAVTIDLGIAGPQSTGGAGFDTLIGIERVLGSAFDDLLQGGADDDRLVGLAGDDQLFGGNGDDVLVGRDGMDMLDGGEGDDILNGEFDDDALVGGVGRDRLNGGSDDDRLEGGDGDDSLIGGSGADTLLGGDGDDWLLGGAFPGGEGVDEFNVIDGGSGDDVVKGGAGTDLVYVLEGDDSVDGNGGDDIFVIRARSPEGQRAYIHGELGYDTLRIVDDGSTGPAFDFSEVFRIEKFELAPTVSITLSDNNVDKQLDTLLIVGGMGVDASAETDGRIVYFADQNVAATVIGGARDDSFIGGAGNDVFRGGGGADRFEGGAGADRLEGGADNDVYTVDDALDTIIELAGEGTDTVFASVDHRLAGNVETLIVSENGDIDGTGNDGRNLLVGGTGANVLAGEGGSDVLKGGAGDDTLRGGADADRLFGEAGADLLEGGVGRDLFLFETVSASGAGASDTILDFERGADRIDLSRIDADTGLAGDQAFRFIGAQAFSDAGQLRVATVGDDLLVQGDVDGDGAADFELLVTLAGDGTLARQDFVL